MKKLAVYHHTYLPLSETFIYRQLTALCNFFDVNVFASELENLSEYPGVVPQKLPRFVKYGRLLGLERRFVSRQLRSADLLHVNFGNHALRMFPYAQRAGVPVTAYFLGYDASSFLRRPDYCRKLQSSAFAHVFVNSEDMKRRLVPFLPSGSLCTVVYCGIPLESFQFKARRGIPSGATFLQVSRLIEKKGVDVSLRAFHRYRQEIDVSARLVIAGDGPLSQQLRRLAVDLGLEQTVTFLGAVGSQRYVDLLQRADVLLHPSRTAPNGDMEGVPTVICEAMACGVPVVATRHSGIPEAIEHGVSGLLAEEGNPDDLFEQLLLLRQAPIHEISVRGRARVEERFDHNVTSAVLARHMLDLIG